MYYFWLPHLKHRDVAHPPSDTLLDVERIQCVELKHELQFELTVISCSVQIHSWSENQQIAIVDEWQAVETQPWTTKGEVATRDRRRVSGLRDERFISITYFLTGTQCVGPTSRRLKRVKIETCGPDWLSVWSWHKGDDRVIGRARGSRGSNC